LGEGEGTGDPSTGTNVNRVNGFFPQTGKGKYDFSIKKSAKFVYAKEKKHYQRHARCIFFL
jgi:hypothetical protein